MTTMPIITDEMVDKFRRTGKRRASYVTGRGNRLAPGDSRVVPQTWQAVCPNGPADNGRPCGPGGLGTCHNGLCIL
jgi:hypothetical protein